jgi:hypothetical protein
MAGSARPSAATKHAYRMFAPSARVARCPGGAADEFEESDVVWGAAVGGGVDYSVPAASRAAGRKHKPAVDAAAGSLPMNIPDWQKILGVEYRDHHEGGWEIDGDDDYCRGVLVPPHELAWRSRAASLSVHEGMGRTLKGRDLSRVRDAVWKKTGFED